MNENESETNYFDAVLEFCCSGSACAFELHLKKYTFFSNMFMMLDANPVGTQHCLKVAITLHYNVAWHYILVTNVDLRWNNTYTFLWAIGPNKVSDSIRQWNLNERFITGVAYPQGCSSCSRHFQVKVIWQFWMAPRIHSVKNVSYRKDNCVDMQFPWLLSSFSVIKEVIKIFSQPDTLGYL